MEEIKLSNLEDFTEITNDVRKIIKFPSEDDVLTKDGSVTEKMSTKSYDIIYVDPQVYINPIILSDFRNRTFENIQGSESLGIVYEWGKWIKWSKCSTTCGIGVQMRKRNCLEKRPTGTDMEVNEFEPFSDGRHKGCIGIYKRYRICSEQECPKDLNQSFRDEQCAKYNDLPFRGQYYDWESYYKEDNECELNCKPIDSNYYATLNKTVIDGTLCMKPSVYYTHFYRGRAVCVQGVCKAVHSSGAIRGSTTNDSPFKCGSVLCRPVSESLTKQNLPFGYLYLTTVVAGSRNISILQLDKSDNYLVLKASNEDHYIINGDEEPSTNGVYKYYGNLFEYKRGSDYEIIKADGPITKPIDLLVLVKGPSPGIKYEYFFPISTASISDEDDAATQWNEFGVPIPPDYGDENQEEAAKHINEKRRRKYLWKLIGFGPCSKSCGGGSQPPIFRCIRDSSPTRFYTQKRCLNLEKPIFHEMLYKCNMQSCPAYWHVEDWEDCVCKNDRGTMHRKVRCVQEQKEGIAVEVNDDNCIETRPHIKEMCPCPKRNLAYRTEKRNVYRHVQPIHISRNTSVISGRDSQKNFRENKSDKSGVWLISDWNQHCSADCGIGIEHRSIFCDRTPPYSDTCDLRVTPDTTRSCRSENSCETGDWFTANWGDCHGDCFSLHRKRHVICVRSGIVVEENECSENDKPIDTEKCALETVEYCRPSWHYSEWTECSKPCNGGTQKRFVKCLEIDPKENILKESTKCKYAEREPIYSSCNAHKCPEIVSQPIETNEIELDPECTDEFPNCNLISKDRFCVLNYYQKNCCKTCNTYF